MELILKTTQKSSKSTSPKRNRYWDKHGGRPQHKKSCLPGMQQRLMRQDILDRVAQYGAASSAQIARALPTVKAAMLAFRVVEDRHRGALIRLAKQNPWTLRIPPKLQTEHFKSAERAMQEAA